MLIFRIPHCPTLTHTFLPPLLTHAQAEREEVHAQLRDLEASLASSGRGESSRGGGLTAISQLLEDVRLSWVKSSDLFVSYT